MKVYGQVVDVYRSSYEAFLKIKYSDIQKEILLSVQGSDCELKLPISENRIIDIDAFIWHVLDIEIVPQGTKTFMKQEDGVNRISACGKVSKIIALDKFECEIDGFFSPIIIDCERDVELHIGDLVSFSGELHAEI